jgi:hypothetical protein
MLLENVSKYPEIKKKTKLSRRLNFEGVFFEYDSTECAVALGLVPKIQSIKQ